MLKDMNEAKKFIMWLDGYLDACGDTLNEKETNKISERLENVFYNEAEEHEIALLTPENKPTPHAYGKRYKC